MRNKERVPLTWCDNPQDVAASYTVGAVSSVVYLNMLNRSIDGVGGDGGGSGGAMAAQPRLLIPLIMAMGYNRCLPPPQRPAAVAAAPFPAELSGCQPSSQAASRALATPCSARVSPCASSSGASGIIGESQVSRCPDVEGQKFNLTVNLTADGAEGRLLICKLRCGGG